MSMIARAWNTWIGTLLIVLMWSFAASAADIVVQLTPTEGKPPQYVCVVGDKQGTAIPLGDKSCETATPPGTPDPKAVTALFRCDAETQRLEDPLWPSRLVEINYQGEETGHRHYRTERILAPRDPRPDAWWNDKSSPKSWADLKSKTGNLSETAEALKALLDSGRRAAGHCPAFIELGSSDSPLSKLGMSCAANSGTEVADGQVAILRLTGASPWIKHITLTGTLLVLRIDEATVPTSARLHSLGGDFASGGSARVHPESSATGEAVRGSASIALEPRCVARQVSIPAGAGKLASITMSIPWSAVTPSYRRDLCPQGTSTCEFDRDGRLDLCAGMPDGACPLSQRPDIWLPTQVQGTPEIRVDVVHRVTTPTPELDPVKPPKDAPPKERVLIENLTSSLATRWSRPFPAAPLSLQASEIHFSWRAGCLYVPTDDASCPAARLPGPGLACRGEWQDAARKCVYRCAADIQPALPEWCDPVPPGETSTAIYFDVPAEVELRVGSQQDRWQEKLIYLNQTFDGFAPRSDRQFTVRQGRAGRTVKVAGCSNTCGRKLCTAEEQARYLKVCSDPKKRTNRHCDYAQRHAQRLAPIEIELHSGEGHDYKLDSRAPARIGVPGTSCGDSLAYRYSAPRQAFSERHAELKDGEFLLEPAQESFRYTWLTGRLSGGVMFEPDVDRSIKNEAGKVRHDPASAIHLPVVEGELALQYRVYGEPIQIEFPVSYMLSTKVYHPLGLTEGSDDARSVLFNRVFSGTRVMGLPDSNIAVGGALGAWFGWAAQGETNDVWGGAFWDFVFRWLPIDGFAVEVDIRTIFPETEQTFLSSRTGSAYVYEQNELRVIPMAGFQFLSPL